MGAVQDFSGYTSVPIDTSLNDPAKAKRNMGINFPNIGLDILLAESFAIYLKATHIARDLTDGPCEVIRI